MKALLGSLIAALAFASSPIQGEAPAWRPAAAGFDWQFPRDHFGHDGYRTEWWYVTGQLQTTTDPPRRFGFQFTLFKVGLTPESPALDSDWAAANLILGHAALGDLDRGVHRFSELLHREVPLLGEFGSSPGPRVAWSVGPAGTPELWSLDWNGAGFDFRAVDRAAGFSLALSTTPSRPLIFQGPGGLSLKSADGEAASLYYSFTRMAASGTVEIDGELLEVSGSAWADREFGSGQLARHQSGWDWFSLQLEDGRDVMLYILRGRDGTVDFGKGTVVDASGAVRRLEGGDWSVTARERWTSPETGATYPQNWELSIPGEELKLRVVSEFAAQENVSRRTGLAYWEGAVKVEGVDGSPGGRGYVELTGYGERNRPGI